MIGNRAILNAVRDAIFLADFETGMIVDANAAAELLSGRALAELLTMHYTELQPPELEESARRTFALHLQNPGAAEGFILRNDGRRIPVEVVSSHFTDPDERRLLIGVVRDITERHAARKALRLSEERFRQVAEAAREFIWEVDADGLYTYASPVVEQILGFTPEEVVGKMHFYDLFVPETREQKKAEALGKIASRVPLRNCLNWRLRKDGNIVALESSGLPVLNSEGALLGYRGADTDVTSRTQAEEELRRSETRARAQAAELQAIMDAAPAVIVVAHDPECRYVGGNGAAHSLLGLPPGGSLSKSAAYVDFIRNFRLMRDGAEVPPGDHPLPKVCATGQPLRDYEVRVSFDDGTSIDLHGNIEPLRDDDGRPRGAVAVLSDVTERKKAEADLRESERRFREMADTAPVMIWVSGTDKLCTFFNKPWLEFTGRTMEQEIGDGWAVNVHPDDLDQCLSTYSSSFDARRSFQMEYRLRRVDGEYRWILDTGTPLYRDHNFSGYIGSCIDVTPLKLIEDQLRANEARFKDAQRLARVASWERDIESGELYWSDEAFRIYGLDPETSLDFTAFLNRIHPKDREKIHETENRVRTSNDPVEVDFRIVRPDGEIRFARSILEAVRNKQGSVLGIVGATQDITDQVHASELLRASEERLKNAERMTHVGNWAFDLKTSHVSWSEETYRIFGKPADYLPSVEGFLEALVPQDRERVQQAIHASIEKGKGHSIDLQIARPNGEIRSLTCTSEIFVDEEGLPVRIFGACQDITELRQVQKQLFARQKQDSVATLAAGIAHDFNNLLGSVVGNAELAQVEYQAGLSPLEALSRIRGVALRGSEIVRQLMAYAGKETDLTEPLDVSAIVGEMVELLKVSISKHARLDVDLGKALPPVRANAGQVRQIAMNLVTNASDAIGDRDGVIRIATSQKGDHLTIGVSDNGIGIPPEMHSRIFDPFFTTKSAGQGMGLAVVQGIVRVLGGEIHLASELGNGASFEVLLPCAKSSIETNASPLPAAGSSQGPREATVLIVEDEDALRQPVSKMLRKSGFDVLEAADGTAAIELLRARTSEIGVVLLDLTIPGASSADVVAEVMKLRPDLKVVLTSAYSSEVAAQIDAPAVQGFVRKPFPFNDLLRALRAASTRTDNR
jgi:PAS domain S-box-containing protein